MRSQLPVRIQVGFLTELEEGIYGVALPNATPVLDLVVGRLAVRGVMCGLGERAAPQTKHTIDNKHKFVAGLDLADANPGKIWYLHKLATVAFLVGFVVAVHQVRTPSSPEYARKGLVL